MYLYLSLVERKVAEFYHNIENRRYLDRLKWLIFIAFSGLLMVSLPDAIEFKLKKCETNLVFFRFATQALLSRLALPHTSKLIWYWKQGRNLNVLYFVHAESDSAKQGLDGSVAVRKKLLLELPAWPFSAFVLWNFWFWIDTKWESDMMNRRDPFNSSQTRL